MLVLSRRKDTSIMVGGDVEIKVRGNCANDYKGSSKGGIRSNSTTENERKKQIKCAHLNGRNVKEAYHDRNSFKNACPGNIGA
jgi:hypothetical protein